MPLYAAPTAHRMAWDVDGSVAGKHAGGAITNLTLAERQTLNDETVGGGYQVGSNNYIFVVFPELRDVKQILVVAINAGDQVREVETSADTTNGQDGTWTQRIANYADVANTQVAMRSPTALDFAGVKGVRALISATQDVRTFHLYGTIPLANSPQRLVFWRPSDHGTPDAQADPFIFDWEDPARASSATKKCRIKNIHSTLQANAPVVSTEILTDGAPAIVDDFLWKLSADPDGNYASSVTVANLVAGAISADITVKRTTPSDAPLGLWWPRFKAVAASWA